MFYIYIGFHFWFQSNKNNKNKNGVQTFDIHWIYSFPHNCIHITNTLLVCFDVSPQMVEN